MSKSKPVAVFCTFAFLAYLVAATYCGWLIGYRAGLDLRPATAAAVETTAETETPKAAGE